MRKMNQLEMQNSRNRVDLTENYFRKYLQNGGILFLYMSKP